MAEITATGSDQAAVQTPDTKKKVPDPKVAGRFGAEYTRIARAAAEREAAKKAAEQAAGVPAGTPKNENRPASGPIPGETAMPGTVRAPINFVNAPQTAGTGPSLSDPKAAGWDDPAKMKADVDAAVEKHSGVFSTTYGTSKAADILNEAAKSNDPKIRANAFNAGAAKLAEIGGDDPAMKAALANLSLKVDQKDLNEDGKKAFMDARFDALKTGDAKAALNGLNADQMKDVAQRLGSLPGEERTSVYQNLAQTATGEQLARLTEANPKLAGNSLYGIPISSPSEFIEAVQSAPGKTKEEYVQTLGKDNRIGQPATQVATPPVLGGSQVLTQHDNMADAAGQVLSTLKGDAFTRAAKDLRPDQVDAIMSNAMYARSAGTADGGGRITDMDLAKKIAQNAATSDDPQVRAKFFQGGAHALAETPTNEENKPLRDALTDILHKKDITQTMAALQRLDPHMTGLTAYLQEKLKNGELDDIARDIARLQAGNDLKTPPADYLKNPDNQLRLGLYSGALQAAAGKNNLSERERLATARDVAKKAVGMLPYGDKAGEVVERIGKAIDGIENDRSKKLRDRMSAMILGVDLTGWPIDMGNSTSFLAGESAVTSHFLANDVWYK